MSGKAGVEHKGTTKAVRCPSFSEISWAAGFLEGEGCFLYYPQNQSQFISAKQVNVEPLVWLQSIFGGNIGFEDRSESRDMKGQFRDDIHVWRVYGSRARGIMMTIYHFLSSERRWQIRRALHEGNAR